MMSSCLSRPYCNVETSICVWVFFFLLCLNTFDPSLRLSLSLALFKHAFIQTQVCLWQLGLVLCASINLPEFGIWETLIHVSSRQEGCLKWLRSLIKHLSMCICVCVCLFGENIADRLWLISRRV